LYDKTSEQLNVNGARKDLFTKKNRAINNIPPTQAALEQHVKSAIYQGGYIWGQAFICIPELSDPANWEWKKDYSGEWQPLWTTLAEASKSCQVLFSCKCVKGCKGRCYKATLTALPYANALENVEMTSTSMSSLGLHLYGL
jgi:hypothetical protein